MKQRKTRFVKALTEKGITFGLMATSRIYIFISVYAKRVVAMPPFYFILEVFI
jgi:hypothetical protein